MGSKHNVDMTATEDTVKIVAADDQPAAGGDQSAQPEEATAEVAKKKALPRRSHTYTSVRAQVDKTKLYDAFAAIELVKKLSYSSFTGTVTADLLVRDTGLNVTLAFPHSTGKTVRVAIADDELLAKVEAGTIDFDILVADPRFMPKLAKLARVLGPKGLMPNPKNGTLTPNPEAKKKELEGGQLTLKTEKKQPVMHVVLGKTDMETKDLVENLQALMAALPNKLLRVTVSATMSPGVKVKIG